MTRPSYELARCTVCGHADANLISTADDIRAEIELLWEFHGARLDVDVPPPRLLDRVAFSEPPPLAVVACKACGLVYRNPTERGHELEQIYADADISEGVLRSLHETQLPAYRAQARRLLTSMGRRGSVLEVGSYVGGFLAAAAEMGLTASGVDVNAAVNRFTRGLGYTVHDGQLDDVIDGRFDAVVIWNTFDQLQDPRATLHAAHRRLRPGGVLALRVPSGAFYARYARRARGRGVSAAWARALLVHNNLLSFPYRVGFTPATLAKLAEECGFTTRRTFGDTLVPIADRWTRTWARLEERLLKSLTRTVLARSAAAAPWFELYAERRD